MLSIDSIEFEVRESPSARALLPCQEGDRSAQAIRAISDLSPVGQWTA